MQPQIDLNQTIKRDADHITFYLEPTRLLLRGEFNS